MTIFDWISVLSVAIGVTLAIWKKKSAFPILILGNVTVIINSVAHNNRTDMLILYIYLTFISLYGYFRWKKEEK